MSSRRIGWASMIGAMGFVGLAALLAAAGCSKDSNPTPTEPGPTPPQAASGLYVSGTSPNQVSLRWRDNSEDELGFRVERHAAGSSEFAEVDTVAANRVSFNDLTVQEGVEYTYRIVAYTLQAAADPSNEVSIRATDNQAPTRPVLISPEEGTAELDPLQPVVLAWSSRDPDGDPVDFDVYFGDTQRSLALVSTQTDTSYTVNGPFERNSHYFWQVVARDSTGISRPSPLWGFNTEVDRVNIEGGPFVMGDDGQFHHPGNPVEVVDFSLDKYEVTNQQYADFLNQKLNRDEITVAHGEARDRDSQRVFAQYRSTTELDSDILFSVSDSAFYVAEGREGFPAGEVSWYGADAYARFYNRRLPNEAEWEKAARGTSELLGVFYDSLFVNPDSVVVDTIGIGYPFPWGTWSGPSDLARLNAKGSGDPYENQVRVRTTPIGFYDGEVHGGYATLSGASPYGVQDMAGNLWEWCNDWYGEYQDPHSPPSSGQFRVIRGGSFDKPYGSATTYNRSYNDPLTTDRTIGFRTAGPPVE